jgi:hypothetical protein
VTNVHDPSVATTDVVHAIAVLTIAFVAIRGFQALAEHYFPNSEAVVAGRFIYGGP